MAICVIEKEKPQAVIRIIHFHSELFTHQSENASE